MSITFPFIAHTINVLLHTAIHPSQPKYHNYYS